MSVVLPQSPRQLQLMLARRLGTAAMVIGFLAGGAAYLFGTREAEQAALDHAAQGLEHFDVATIEAAVQTRAGTPHPELARMLDNSRFVGIRIFGPDAGLIYETWADVPPAISEAVRVGLHVHAWPGRGRDHRNWMDVGQERLLQVVLPLYARNG